MSPTAISCIDEFGTFFLTSLKLIYDVQSLGARSEAIVSRNCKARLLPRFSVVTVSVALEYEGGFGVSLSDMFSIGLQSERKEEFE